MSSSESAHDRTSSEQQRETGEVWTELKRGSKGVGLTVYHQTDDGIDVLDESWWTWAEFTGIDTQELPISISGTVSLNATPSRPSVTGSEIADIVHDAGLYFADPDDVIGCLGGEPVYDELEVIQPHSAVDILNDELPGSE